MYQGIATRVLTCEVRLSYAHLTTPYTNPRQPNATPKYQVTLLIPKTEDGKATKADIEQAMEAAAQDAVSKKWKGYRPAQLVSVLHDGDGTRKDGTPYGEECKNHWVMTASSTNKPAVCDSNNIRVDLAPQDIYSGMYARVCLNFFGYNTGGNKGVGCGLQGVMKTRDGEPLSGAPSAASMFAGVGRDIMDEQQVQGQGSYTAAPRINPITGQPM